MPDAAGGLPTREFKPHMSDGEFALLQKYTPTGAVLEFGAGGSSAFFAEHGVERLISVEADREWIHQLLLGHETLRKWAKTNRWKPIFADIGPVAAWSEPSSKTPLINWLNYHYDVWSHIDSQNLKFILIDGRFRVSCALQYLLRSQRAFVPVAIHDFWNREYYHCLLQFFDVVDQEDTMVVFLKKKKIIWKNLSLCLLRHQLDYR